MKAICNDGTRIDCQSFEATETGIHLFADQDQDQQIGFVPVTTLQYVLPDDVEPRAMAAQQAMQAQAGQQVPQAGGPQPTPGQQPIQRGPQQPQSGMQRR